MDEVIEKVVGYDGKILRNTVIASSKFNVFDDLSDDPSDWAVAKVATDFAYRFSATKLQYNAIDYVFDQSTWAKSRFCDGTFPVWYGSKELKTTFYETVYHWKQFILDSPELLETSKNETIYTMRTVFSAVCESTLIDLRDKAEAFPYLISKDNYENTQNLGVKLAEDGFPGLITYSARLNGGVNFAVFNKSVLKSPGLEGDYLYQIIPGSFNRISIFTLQEKKKVCVVY